MDYKKIEDALMEQFELLHKYAKENENDWHQLVELTDAMIRVAKCITTGH